ncbi:bifunctional (p)ppGpp synthetase/guanosine-3',5'-bis(diphosphate) 3'-pyrophosphohydrolase [Candidatus Uhrbacteria bacterium]|nr:bifunctional (p)ppGpp synthetase/guanosine-3',5'-bis(diphosphate) 3'-pyrophosphohydrolase [Candidatus Uhrbacteria bacterium]
MVENKKIDYFGGESDADRWADVKQRRLDSITEEGKAFEARVKDEFPPEEAERIEAALDWMIALHASQEDRKKGELSLAHPLAVAAVVEREYDIQDPDLIIAALLHDVVEDQPLHLAMDSIYAKYPESREFTEKEIKKRYGQEIRELALVVIGGKFGDRVASLVDHLSNPDFNTIAKKGEMAEDRKSRNEVYKEYIAGAIKDPDVFVVKMADFLINVVNTGNLSHDDPKKQKLLSKYGPVIQEVFLPALATLDEHHPLYSRKQALRDQLRDVYQKEYEGKY